MAVSTKLIRERSSGGGFTIRRWGR